MVGRLALARKGGRLEISLNLPRARARRLGAKIEAEVADIARFEGTWQTAIQLLAAGAPIPSPRR